MRNGICYGCILDVECVVSGLSGDEGESGGDFEVIRRGENPVEAMREE